MSAILTRCAHKKMYMLGLRCAAFTASMKHAKSCEFIAQFVAILARAARTKNLMRSAILRCAAAIGGTRYRMDVACAWAWSVARDERARLHGVRLLVRDPEQFATDAV